MTHAIDKELQEYITMLNTNQKKSILAVIKTFLQPAETPARISRAQYNIEINEALDRVKAGHYLTQEDVEKDAAAW